MNKVFVATSLLFLFTFLISEAQIDSQKLLYLKKVEKYKRMKNTGIPMIVVGVGSTIAGIATLSSISSTTYGTTNNQNSKAVSGSILTLVGFPLAIGGTVLTIIGGINVERYKRKLEGLSFNYNPSPSYHQFTLTYKF